MREASSLIAIIGLTLGGINLALADYCGEGGLDGVAVNESTRQMVGVWYQPVLIPDRTGIRTSATIAFERAKEQIIRYFETHQSGDLEIETSTTETATTTFLADSKGNQLSSSVSREQYQIITQTSRSMTSGTLRGIQLLEQSYNKDENDLCVAVSFSAKSNEIARESKKWMEGEQEAKESEGQKADDPKLAPQKEPESYHKKREPIT